MSDDEKTINLGLEQVRERFEESARTLSTAREKLDELSESANAQVEATRGLQDASTQVSEFTAAAKAAVKGLENAQTSVSASFDALSQLIDESDIKAVREGVDLINKRLDKVTELESRLSESREQLASVQSDFDLLKKFSSSRTLKKAGLE